MARTQGVKSQARTYHVMMMRGNERRAIFHDGEDYGRFESRPDIRSFLAATG